MEYRTIFNATVFFIMGLLCWFIAGFVISGLEPTIITQANAHPAWFGWWDTYQEVYHYTPILITGAVVIYLFTSRSDDNREVILR